MVAKEIEVELTQEQCDELNELEERLFGHWTKEMKEMFGVKKHKPHKFKVLFG